MVGVSLPAGAEQLLREWRQMERLTPIPADFSGPIGAVRIMENSLLDHKEVLIRGA